MICGFGSKLGFLLGLDVIMVRNYEFLRWDLNNLEFFCFGGRISWEFVLDL